MADSGVFRINPLQAWQREAILTAAQVMRERFGATNPKALALRFHAQVEESMAREAVEHMVEEGNPGRDFSAAAAVEPEIDPDLGLFGLALKRRAARRSAGLRLSVVCGLARRTVSRFAPARHHFPRRR